MQNPDQKLNIYICSTVRHLLFSLLRAAHTSSCEHHILYFSDYQNAPLTNWNLSGLPFGTHVYELQRASFREQLKGCAKGKMFYFLAMRNLSSPKFLNTTLLDLLTEDCPELAHSLKLDKPAHLLLFNERNKMARMFRLLVPGFSIIEDGESNYHGIPSPWWKQPARLLLRRPLKFRHYGEDRRCKNIFVQHPESLPEIIHDKGRKIDFLDDELARGTISAIFGQDAALPDGSRIAVLATQPLDAFDGISLKNKQQIYKTISDHLISNGWQVLLKIHPSEELSDYGFLVSHVTVIPGKIPIEATLTASSNNVVILSLWSAAGLGFDDFCKRIKLVDDNHQDQLRNWALRPELIVERLIQKLPA